jgi:hypothetical protein
MYDMTKSLLPKTVLAVTFIVSLAACSHSRKRIDEGEARVIPQSEFAPGESWRDSDEFEAPKQYASTKDSFRSRVKKTSVKSRKSIVSSR